MYFMKLFWDTLCIGNKDTLLYAVVKKKNTLMGVGMQCNCTEGLHFSECCTDEESTVTPLPRSHSHLALVYLLI